MFDLWGDLAAWFFVGLLLAGLITVLIPDDVFSKYLGSGLPAMLLMLAVGKLIRSFTPGNARAWIRARLQPR